MAAAAETTEAPSDARTTEAATSSAPAPREPMIKEEGVREKLRLYRKQVVTESLGEYGPMLDDFFGGEFTMEFISHGACFDAWRARNAKGADFLLRIPRLGLRPDGAMQDYQKSATELRRDVAVLPLVGGDAEDQVRSQHGVRIAPQKLCSVVFDEEGSFCFGVYEWTKGRAMDTFRAGAFYDALMDGNRVAMARMLAVVHTMESRLSEDPAWPALVESAQNRTEELMDVCTEQILHYILSSCVKRKGEGRGRLQALALETSADERSPMFRAVLDKIEFEVLEALKTQRYLPHSDRPRRADGSPALRRGEIALGHCDVGAKHWIASEVEEGDEGVLDDESGVKYRISGLIDWNDLGFVDVALDFRSLWHPCANVQGWEDADFVPEWPFIDEYLSLRYTLDPASKMGADCLAQLKHRANVYGFMSLKAGLSVGPFNVAAKSVLKSLEAILASSHQNRLDVKLCVSIGPWAFSSEA